LKRQVKGGRWKVEGGRFKVQGSRLNKGEGLKAKDPRLKVEK